MAGSIASLIIPPGPSLIRRARPGAMAMTALSILSSAQFSTSWILSFAQSTTSRDARLPVVVDARPAEPALFEVPALLDAAALPLTAEALDSIARASTSCASDGDEI